MGISIEWILGIYFTLMQAGTDGQLLLTRGLAPSWRK